MRSGHGDSSEPHKRRIVLGVSSALLIVMALPVVVITVPIWARWMAVRQVDAGAISEAQQWLRRSAWFAFSSGETELMRAACFRRLGQMTRWESAWESSREKAANPHRLQQERVLGLIRQGAHEVPENYWKNPLGMGLRPYDAIEVCVRGYLARNESGKAEQILAFWAAALPQDAHVTYLQGVYWFNQGDEAKALAAFEHAVARRSSHELAHVAVARLLEKQDRLAEALPAYIRFASHCPHSDTAVAGLARVLRKLTRLDDARAVAGSLKFSSDPFSEFRAEIGAIELELGNSQESLRSLAQAPAADEKKKRELQGDAAMALALQEESAAANRLFEQADAEIATESRVSELLSQLAVAPGRKAAADELERLSDAAARPAVQSTRIELERSSVARREVADLTGAELYALSCGACHGDNGNGDGRAARHQFPRPRDLRTEGFRLVSTDNGVPTIADLEKVIKRGMPGTSMRPFDDLSQNQLRLLAEEVLRLRRHGVRDRYVALLRAEDEEIDEQDVQQVVDLHSLPGDVMPVPVIGPADPSAVARGRDVYLASGCRSCHGEAGMGVSDVALFDHQGLVVLPRDLANDPFKGGHEPESICRRILAGMPGSPHPATRALTDQQCVDLVHYCGSLSRQPKRTLTNHQRFLEATQRPLPSVIPEATTDANDTADDCP